MTVFHHHRRVTFQRRKLSSLELLIFAGAVFAACFAGFASRSFLPL